MPSRTRTHALLLAAPHLLLGLGVVLRFATTPDPRGFGTHEQLGGGPCGFREWLGRPCPTCGVTTSVSHLVRGDVASSWSAQPLGIVGTAFVLWLCFAAWRVHRRGDDLTFWWLRHGARIWAGAAIAVASCWAIALALTETGSVDRS